MSSFPPSQAESSPPPPHVENASSNYSKAPPNRRDRPQGPSVAEGQTLLPATQPQLVPNLSVPPADPAADSFTALKKESRVILLLHWTSLAHPPPDYGYLPSLTPHPFMGLPKFLAGRLHQMRSGKSYLAAHPSWYNWDTPSTCPRCRVAAETFEHAILHCVARRRLKESLLPALTSLDAASPLWTSDNDIAALSRFIALTATGYPPDMFPPSPSSSIAHSPPPSPSFSPSPRLRFSPVEDG